MVAEEQHLHNVILGGKVRRETLTKRNEPHAHPTSPSVRLGLHTRAALRAEGSLPSIRRARTLKDEGTVEPKLGEIFDWKCFLVGIFLAAKIQFSIEDFTVLNNFMKKHHSIESPLYEWSILQLAGPL